MRLPYEYVARLRDAFGECIRMLTAVHDGTVVAAALLYRIAPGHDLVQYWGDHHDLPCSPMALLARDVVAHSLASGGSFVDLGVSTDHGLPNLGLMQFKRSVGASVETRLEVVGRDGLDHPGWSLLDA
jgi:CelD/BcsL family acetyltransferase involved in cellulose biosynthesis